ncbi:MAG: zinc ribbon domain-containing protein [Intestinibacter sp.]
MSTCSQCKKVKIDLRLKDRIYKCNYFEFTMGRDLNASINLSKYKSA